MDIRNRFDGFFRSGSSGLLQLGQWVEARRWPLLTASLALFVLSRLSAASSFPLWYDENVNRDIALLPHLKDIWGFYASGADTVGPSSALILAMFKWLPISPEIWSRLPFLLCYVAMAAGVFLFVVRRYPAVYAFAALILVLSEPLLDFATEAKSYSTEWAALLFAMLCWQAALCGRRPFLAAAGVWLGLSVALFCHKFAIFYLLPFALGTAARGWKEGTVDRPMAAAILLSPAVMLLTLHGDLLAAHLYGSNFWARPTLTDLHEGYKTYFGWLWAFVLVALLLAIVVPLLKQKSAVSEAAPDSAKPGFSMPEWVLVLTLTALPLYAVPASLLLHVYRSVYVLAFAIGMGVMLAAVAAAGLRRDMAGGTLLAVLFALMWLPGMAKQCPQGLRVLLHPAAVHGQLAASYQQKDWVSLLEKSDLPVVAGDHSLYSTMHVYVSPQLDRRLFYLIDESQIPQHPQGATAQINFQRVGPMLGYRAVDGPSFLCSHRHFLLLVGSDPAMWLPDVLLDQAQHGRARLELVGAGFQTPDVYEVRLSPDAPGPGGGR